MTKNSSDMATSRDIGDAEDIRQSIPVLFMWQRDGKDAFELRVALDEIVRKFKEWIKSPFRVVLLDRGIAESLRNRDSIKNPFEGIVPDELFQKEYLRGTMENVAMGLAMVLEKYRGVTRYYAIDTEDTDLQTCFVMYASSTYPGQLVTFTNRSIPDEKELRIIQPANLYDVNAKILQLREKEQKDQFGSDGFGCVDKDQAKLLDAIARMRYSPGLLLLGETGVGKTYVAKKYEELVRKYFPVKEKSKNVTSGEKLDGGGNGNDSMIEEVNCSCFTESNFLYEMFGYKKGAYTGAVADTNGFFQKADEKVLFLDEVADLSPANQARLLTSLDRDNEGYYTFKIFGDKAKEPRKVRFRLVCATRKDLGEEIRNGRFREDLYYRIAGCVIKVKPLREHRNQIPVLVEQFQKLYDTVDQFEMPNELKRLLSNHDWPGNIRQLKHVVETLIIRHKAFGNVTKNDLQSIFNESELNAKHDLFVLPSGKTLNAYVNEFELAVFDKYRQSNPGNPVKQTLERLGIDKNLFYEFKKRTVNINRQRKRKTSKSG